MRKLPTADIDPIDEMAGYSQSEYLNRLFDIAHMRST